MSVYKVQSGETLSQIAQNLNTTVEKLVELNNIKNPNSIMVGQEISYDDQKGSVFQNEHSLKTSPSIPLEEIYDDKQIQEGDSTNLATKIKNLYKGIVNNPHQATLQRVSIDGANAHGFTLNPKFYANNFDRDLAKITLQSGEPNKVEIAVNMGQEISHRDRSVSDFLKKVVGDNLDNTSLIVQDSGSNKIFKKRLETTDLYKAFTSPDVNPDMFTQEQNGKYKDDVFVKGYSGNVTLPSLEINDNGAKYFALHDKAGNILYFDETGKTVDIKDLQKVQKQQTSVNLPDDTKISEYLDEKSSDFVKLPDYDNSKLNVGEVYLNGAKFDVNMKSNFYANPFDTLLAEKTLNSQNIDKLEVQIQAGTKINDRDLSAKDILKKHIGDNFDNTTEIEANNISDNKLENTDMYKKFVEINPEITTSSKGKDLLVQLPTLKIDNNGNRYFVLLEQNNQPVYFDATGKILK